MNNQLKILIKILKKIKKKLTKIALLTNLEKFHELIPSKGRNFVEDCQPTKKFTWITSSSFW